MNKQHQSDSGIHDTSAHCPRVYQVKSSSAYSSQEKCDEKFSFERLRNERVTESQSRKDKANPVQPPLFQIVAIIKLLLLLLLLLYPSSGRI